MLGLTIGHEVFRLFGHFRPRYPRGRVHRGGGHGCRAARRASYTVDLGMAVGVEHQPARAGANRARRGLSGRSTPNRPEPFPSAAPWARVAANDRRPPGCPCYDRGEHNVRRSAPDRRARNINPARKTPRRAMLSPSFRPATRSRLALEAPGRCSAAPRRVKSSACLQTIERPKSRRPQSHLSEKPSQELNPRCQAPRS